MPDAIQLMYSVRRAPYRAAALRNIELPDRILDVIQLTGSDTPSVREAAAFFLQQTLFFDGADSYRVLGVRPNADSWLIKQHYRWLIRWLHPDRHNPASVFADRVNRAWNDLRTPGKRAEYDLRRTPSLGASSTRFRPPIYPSWAWCRRLPERVGGTSPSTAAVLSGAVTMVAALSLLWIYLPWVPIRDGLSTLFDSADTRTNDVAGMIVPDQLIASLPTASHNGAPSSTTIASTASLAAAPKQMTSTVDASPQPSTPLVTNISITGSVGGNSLSHVPDSSSPPPSAQGLSRRTKAESAPMKGVEADLHVRSGAVPHSSINQIKLMPDRVVSKATGKTQPHKRPEGKTESIPAETGKSVTEVVALQPIVEAQEREATRASSVPSLNPATKPAAIAALSSSAEKGEISVGEAQAVVDHFLDAYQKGDIDQLNMLIDQNAEDDLHPGVKLREAYRQLFSTSLRCNLVLHDLNWSMKGDAALGDGRYEATVIPRGWGRTKIERGNIRIHVSRGHDGEALLSLQTSDAHSP